MSILVQKFGGTSLATVEARNHAIRHIRKAISEQHQVVVVVSAMGRRGEPYATDTLIEWIRSNGNALPSRERDLLLGCGEIISAATLCSLLHAEGIKSTVLTGPQAGIWTDGNFGNAHIDNIDPSAVLRALDRHQVVIVTGFQGKSADGELTTLGRGGSDTSATAIGAALKAERVDIFTDVTGILTADPRIVEEARLLQEVTYTEICNLAYHGAKVIHPRAVEVAMQAQIPIRVRSTFSDDEGTLVRGDYAHGSRVSDRFVTGIAHVQDISQIQVLAGEGQYDLQLKVFKAMAMNGISIDFINVNPVGVVYTVFDEETDKAVSILAKMELHPIVQRECAKVSIIGGGMNGVPGIMAEIVEALTEEDIQILQSSDSNSTIWVLVRKEFTGKAVNALHNRFMLHK